MALSTFYHAKITGISTIVPPDEISIDDELHYYENSQKKVDRVKNVIGIDKRRFVKPNTTASDLCQQAAENLLKDMKIDKKSIDALIFISQTPDHKMPATACILQDKLGLSTSCACFDVNQGCTAYTYGLWLASSLIESKASKKVLLLVGGIATKAHHPANKVIAPIFGDAGSASLIEYSEEKTISHFSLGTDGSGAEALIVPIGGARCDYVPNVDAPESKEDYQEIANVFKPIHDTNNNPWYLNSLYMNGVEVFNFTFSTIPPHLLDLLEYAKIKEENIDYLILHQANKQIVQSIIKKVGFSLEKAPTETMSKFGNLEGCSIPATICDQIKDKVENQYTKLLLCGYGVGLSWASAILNLDNIYCSGIRNYIYPEKIQTREEYIEYWTEKFKNN